MSVLKFTKYILFYKVTLFLIIRIIINGCTSLISTMLSPKVQIFFLIKKSWGGGEECPFRTENPVLFSSVRSELNEEICLLSAFFECFCSDFAVFLLEFQHIFMAICEDRKQVIYTKSRHPCGCRLLDDRGCLSEGVSEGRSGFPEFWLGVDAVDEVTHGCSGSFAPCDGPLLLSGWEMTFGPDAATAPAVGASVKIDEIRVQAPDGFRRSCSALSAGGVCSFHITLYLRRMPRFRVGNYTQHSAVYMPQVSL